MCTTIRLLCVLVALNFIVPVVKCEDTCGDEVEAFDDCMNNAGLDGESCQSCVSNYWPAANCSSSIVTCAGLAMCSLDCGPCGQEFITKENCLNPGCEEIQCEASSGNGTNSDDADDSDQSDLFSDPSFAENNWAFRLLNVAPAWNQGLTGKGIHIRINDPHGVDSDHPEFDGKFDYNASCTSYQSYYSFYYHGTSCASIAAGRSNNGECSVGIAPGATISACLAEADQHQSMIHALDAQDISSNSYSSPYYGCEYSRRLLGRRHMQASCPFLSESKNSPCLECDFSSEPLNYTCTYAIGSYCSNRTNFVDDEYACLQYLELFATCEFGALPPEAQAVFTKAIKEGRDGKGLVILFSAGNDFATGSDSNFGAYTASRLVISVGAVAGNGTHASYSNTGASVFVSAPGGELSPELNWVTARPQGQCEGGFGGTSAAAPAVAGVIALMLEVNPILSWRDVQGILASTSQVMDPDDESWVTNAAGFSHSYKYGFGVVDAGAAVEAASSWINFGAEAVLTASSRLLNIAIKDDGTVVESSVTVNGIMTVESVVVYLDLDSSSRGHLKIILTSPGGTESILTPGMRPENGQLPETMRWKLMTLRSWGESSAGEWTLTISDTKPGDVDQCVDLPLDRAYDDPSNSAGCDGLYSWSSECSYTDYIEACCACGGGQNASSIDDQLVSWMIVVYGRDKSGVLEPTLSPGPTFSMETLPITEFPTYPATDFPTFSPFDDDDFASTNPSAAPTAPRCPNEADALDDCLLQNQVDGSCVPCVIGYWPENVEGCSDVDDETCIGLERCSCDPCEGYFLQFVNCLLLDSCIPLQCSPASPSVAPAPRPATDPASPPAPVPVPTTCSSPEDALNDCLFQRVTAAQSQNCRACMEGYVEQVFPAGSSSPLSANATCGQLQGTLCPYAKTECPTCDPCRGEYVSLLECRVDAATTGCELSCSSVSTSGTAGLPVGHRAFPRSAFLLSTTVAAVAFAWFL